MASRTIAIRITIDNKDALNAAKAQVILTREMNKETAKQTHLQDGLTNSFIKGNLAARAISIGYMAIKNAMAASAVTAIDFEHTLAKLSAVSDASAGAMGSLEATVRSLSLATNQNQVDLAKTALEMAKMGLSTSQVEKALGSVAMLSRALDEDLVMTGETVVGIMNAYNMTAADTDKITNQLAFTVKASALDMEKFAVAFSYVGGTAAGAGVSIEELQGSMDILSNAGIRASTIGTSLRRIISDLSDENSKASRAAGGTIESFGGLGNALEALKSKHIDIDGLTEIFGRTASSTSSILIKYAAAMKEMAKQTGESTDIVKPMSDVMNQTLSSALSGITVAWKDLGIEISHSTGFLKTFASAAKEALQGVTNVLATQKNVDRFKTLRPGQYADAALEAQSKGGVVDMLLGAGRTFTGQDYIAPARIAESQQYKRFMVEQGRLDKQNELRSNITDNLLETFKGQKLPKGFDPDKDLPKIKPVDTKMYNYLASLYGTDKEGFQKAVDAAKLKFALKAEEAAGEKFDTDSLAGRKGKREKIDYVELDPFVMMGNKLNEQQSDGQTYQEKFAGKLAKERAEAAKKAGSPVKQNLISEKEIEAFVAGMKEADFAILKAQDSFVAMQASVQGVNGSVDILSHYFIEGVFSDKKDPFKHISDAFGDFAKKMAADLVALTVKILFFRALIARIKLIPGGAGAIPFVTQLATATTGVKFASGTDQVVTKPTMFMAGESGMERVTVTPRAKMSSGGSGGGITVNIQGDVLDGAKFAEAVHKAQKRLRGRYA